MSEIAWLAYSEHERQKALDVIDLFREKNTVDELGISTVRDAIADLLFPGTSTIQTRARYFFFIPWIYQDLERRRVPSSEIARKGRAAELKLVEVLRLSDDPSGTIGQEARSRLKRLPSSVYWRGLGRLGFGLFPGPLAAYHRSLSGFYLRNGDLVHMDGEEPTPRAANWHTGIPPSPHGFPDGASFSLTRAEAEYFQDRLRQQAPQSLFTRLVGSDVPELEEADFVWEDPRSATVPLENQAQVRQARSFSEAIHGAPLLYNLMLAEKSVAAGRPNMDQRVEGYRVLMGDWQRCLLGRSDTILGWDRAAFWRLVDGTGANVPPGSRRFINAWLDLTLGTGEITDPTDDPRARELIHRRERALKGGLARLDSNKALRNWGGASGTGQLDFRWGRIVRQLVSDVRKGLEA